MGEKMAGKYSFVSQDKFKDWLKAEGFNMILRNALASTKPDVTIEVNGQQIKITAKIMVKTIVQEFTLDKPSTYDPGSGTPDTFINFLQGNTLITKKANNNQKIEAKEFTDSGFVQSYFNNSITATRT